MKSKQSDQPVTPLSIFKIDDEDLKLMELFQDTPGITHAEIARRIHRSQPAVGARVTKLERKDLLCTQKGVNLNSDKIKEKIFVLFVDMAIIDPGKIMDSELEACPFVINAFKRSGTKNLTVMLAATRIEKLESIIDKHFRSNPDVSILETALVVDIAKNFIMPLNWTFLNHDSLECDGTCGEVCCKNVAIEP